MVFMAEDVVVLSSPPLSPTNPPSSTKDEFNEDDFAALEDVVVAPTSPSNAPTSPKVAPSSPSNAPTSPKSPISAEYLASNMVKAEQLQKAVARGKRENSLKTLSHRVYWRMHINAPIRSFLEHWKSNLVSAQIKADFAATFNLEIKMKTKRVAVDLILKAFVSVMKRQLLSVVRGLVRNRDIAYTYSKEIFREATTKSP